MYWALGLGLIVLCPLAYLAIAPKIDSLGQMKSIHAILGLAVLSLVGGVDGYFGVSSGKFSSLITMALMALATFRYRKEILKLFLSAYFLLNTTLFILISLIVFGPSPRMFQFVNPDPYGYAAVTGLMSRYDGLRNGLEASIELTGARLTSNLDWSNPENFPIVESPWFLPDFVDKYGLSNGWIHHNGMSYLFQIFKDYIPTISGFFSLWMVVCIITLIFANGAVCDSYQFVSSKVANSRIASSQNRKANKKISVNDNPSTQKKSFKSLGLQRKFDIQLRDVLLPTVVFMGCSLNSPIISMFILEGFANQLLSFLFVLGIACYLCKDDIQVKEFYAPLILVLGTTVVYAQHLAFAVAVLSVYAVTRTFQRLKDNTFKLSAYSLLIAVLGALGFLVTPASDLLIKYFVNSGVGGANHLGPISPLQATGIDPFYKGIYSNPLNPDGTNKIVMKEWRGLLPEGYVFDLPSQGITFFENSAPTILLQLVLMVLFIVYSCFKYRNFLLVGLAGSSLAFITLSVIYLYLQSSSLILQRPGTGFNDYLWMRLLHPVQLFFCVFFTIVISLSVSKVRRRRSIKIFLVSILVLFFTLSLGRNHLNAQKIEQYGRPAVIMSECPPSDFFRNNVFLVDSLFPFVSLAICSDPVLVSNDSFPSRIPISQNQGIINVDFERDSMSYSFAKIATIINRSQIQAPCDMSCLKASQDIDFLD